jgi:CelD/BcsL family acetyltransferase involved in cellulose biosynthesis
LVGVAPLYLASEKTQLGTVCRVLRFVGDGSFDSDYLGLLIQPGTQALLAQRFAEWLCDNREWDALVLRELPEDSALPEAMRDAANRGGLQWRLEYGRCGVLELPRTFEEYLRTRQSRFRTKLRSLLRRLDEGEFTFESRCEPRELRGRLRSLFALHQSRWRDSGAPGVFGSATKRRFYARFVPRFARNGWLRLYSLRNGTTYLAHQLCFGGGGITYLLQEGFDASDPAASYGQMLRAAVVRDLIQRGETRYDFLGGFSKHKEDWGAREGKTVHLVLARKHWRGWLYFNVPLWRERLAREAKRVLPEAMLDRLRRSPAAGI